MCFSFFPNKDFEFGDDYPVPDVPSVLEPERPVFVCSLLSVLQKFGRGARLSSPVPQFPSSPVPGIVEGSEGGDVGNWVTGSELQIPVSVFLLGTSGRLF